MRRLTLIAILLMAALPLALTSCRPPQPPPSDGGKAVVPQPPAQPPGPSDGAEGVGQKVPDFSVTDIDGKSHRPKDYAGQVLIIDFWATNCKACVKKLGEYAVESTLKQRDVALLALSMDDTDEVMRGWRKQQGDEFTIPLAHADDTVRQAFFGRMAIVPIPQARVVDRKGIVRYAFGPEGTHDQLKDAVKTLLAEK